MRWAFPPEVAFRRRSQTKIWCRIAHPTLLCGLLLPQIIMNTVDEVVKTRLATEEISSPRLGVRENPVIRRYSGPLNRELKASNSLHSHPACQVGYKSSERNLIYAARKSCSKVPMSLQGRFSLEAAHHAREGPYLAGCHRDRSARVCSRTPNPAYLAPGTGRCGRWPREMTDECLSIVD
jgi:hypothetical protein